MNKRILVADDEEVLRMLISDTLEDEGYIIKEAENGKAAWEILQLETLDLVILDYMMPGLNGIEVAEKINQGCKNRPPIIMLTAKTQESDVEMSKNAGIQYFMGKPFSPIELIQLVEEILT
ncbi:response regulator [Halobacillus halophilus]|uniref:response regulator n=1 Tax=Halobacillus halophilus TaxID=1570 RepID=UPI001CD54FE5|nr:response regulator [Halobacillus halophilus]MCA1011217.1 response regulator [Halobacillus halophilus]